MASLAQFDLCLISTRNSSLFISARFVTEISISGWKSLAFFLVSHKIDHLLFEQFDVLEGGIKVDKDVHELTHGFAARDVIDPQGVENNVGDLGLLVVLDSSEYRVEQGDFVNNIFDHHRCRLGHQRRMDA